MKKLLVFLLIQTNVWAQQIEIPGLIEQYFSSPNQRVIIKNDTLNVFWYESATKLNPQEFRESILHLTVGQTVSRNKFLFKLVENLYQRAGDKFERGMFRAMGETVDIFLAYADYAIRIGFWGDEIETISSNQTEALATE